MQRPARTMGKKMKVCLEKENFLTTLNHVQSVVERRNTLPILSHILLEARDSKLFLRSTDMSITITDWCQASIERKGSATIAASSAFDIVRKLAPEMPIWLEATKEKLLLFSGRSRFTLPALKVEDFPAMSGDALPHTFKIEADVLVKIIENTRFAISTEETRHYLNGIYCHVTSENLCAVATDGHRLAKSQIAAPIGADNLPGIIVPRKTIFQLYKILEQAIGPVIVSCSPKTIKFVHDNTTLTSQLIDGTFPEYERVIPSDNPIKFSVDKISLRDAIDRVSTMLDGKMRPIKMILKNNVLSLQSNHNDMGSGFEEIKMDYTDAPLEIGFNARYLLDVITQIPGTTVTFAVKDSASPTKIQSAIDDSTLYVVMPMRI